MLLNNPMSTFLQPFILFLTLGPRSCCARKSSAFLKHIFKTACNRQEKRCEKRIKKNSKCPSIVGENLKKTRTCHDSFWFGMRTRGFPPMTRVSMTGMQCRWQPVHGRLEVQPCVNRPRDNTSAPVAACSVSPVYISCTCILQLEVKVQYQHIMCIVNINQAH